MALKTGIKLENTRKIKSSVATNSKNIKMKKNLSDRTIQIHRIEKKGPHIHRHTINNADGPLCQRIIKDLSSISEKVHCIIPQIKEMVVKIGREQIIILRKWYTDLDFKENRFFFDFLCISTFSDSFKGI